MTQRIVALALGVVTIAVAALLIPAALAMRNNSLYSARLELQREAAQLASSLGPTESLQLTNLIGIDREGDPHKIALYSSTGTLADGVGPAGTTAAVQQALRGGFGEDFENGEHSVTFPVPRTDGFAVLRVAESYNDPLSDARLKVVRLVGLTLAILAAALLLAYSLARRITRPLGELSAAATAIGAGDFDTPIPTSGLSELDEFAAALSAMARRIEYQVERERAFPTQVSHQLRTPITALRVALETELAAPRPDSSTIATEALGAVDRMERTVNDLLHLTRGQPEDRADVDLAAVAVTLADRWRPRLAGVGRAITVEATAVPTVRVSRSALDHILEVVLDNSLRHGRGTTRLGVGELDGEIALSVGDKARLPADPFLTPVVAGHGVGLKLARALAEAEGARLHAVDEDGNRFELVFPTSDAAAATPRASQVGG